jgi:magnesium-transporting ATPase (P-type)
MNDGTLIEIKSSQIMVGDIIWVPDEVEIPADILIIGGGNV